jgi:hypothetical protein
LEELQRLLLRATIVEKSTCRSKFQILPHDITRRLGNEAVQQLIDDYRSGHTTIQLMDHYNLGKSSVLKLLRAHNVTLRRQPVTDSLIQIAITLYESGKPLAAIEEQLEAPRESIRRALIDAGVTMRPRGGSNPKT